MEAQVKHFSVYYDFQATIIPLLYGVAFDSKTVK